MKISSKKFRKGGLWWHLHHYQEAHKAIYKQTLEEDEDSRIVGWVVCKVKWKKPRCIMFKEIPGRYAPLIADRDFGTNAWQFKGEEDRRAWEEYVAL